MRKDIDRTDGRQSTFEQASFKACARAIAAGSGICPVGLTAAKAGAAKHSPARNIVGIRYLRAIPRILRLASAVAILGESRNSRKQPMRTATVERKTRETEIA